MLDRSDKPSPWTLRFGDAEVELSYGAFDPSGDLVLSRTVLIILGAYACIDAMIWPIIDVRGWMRFHTLEFGLGLLMLGTFLISLKPFAVRRRRGITVAILIVVIVLLMLLQLNAGEDFVRSLSSLWTLVMMICTMLTPHFRAKIAVNTLAMGCGAYWFNTSAAFNAHEARAHVNLLFFTYVITSAMAYCIELSRRRRFAAERLAERERQRSEALLFNVLPRAIAERLKEATPDERIVDHGDRVAVLFADIAGFTSYAATRSAAQIVAELDGLFARFDAVMAQHKVEKIKTIGDAYMAVAGLPIAHPDAAGAIAEAALDMLAVVERLRALGAVPFSVRIGLHIGPVVAGVIGRSRFLYDLWGDTVNVAARLESTGEAGRIQISDELASALGGRFTIESRGKVLLKGRGEVECHFLLGRAGFVTSSAAPLSAA